MILGSPTKPKSLDVWLCEQGEDKFPRNQGANFVTRFNLIAETLNRAVHPHVGPGAALADGSYLTDHGPDHIETVIQRASELLAYPPSTYPQFSAYEIYLLLLAMHFHDVGNIFGRSGHEANLATVMQQFQTLTGEDMIEWRAIKDIAEAHGGDMNGNKDTISKLLPSGHVRSERVQYRALAALLRFADELADDAQRAARYMEVFDLLPKSSQVHHAYSQSLHSVIVDAENFVVSLDFAFLRSDAMRKFGKGVAENLTSDVYLLDEIYDRTIKMHLERIYCMRFLVGISRIDAINVRIDVYEDRQSMRPCCDTIGYRLEELGYPPGRDQGISQYCPSIQIDGAILCERLSSEQRP